MAGELPVRWWGAHPSEGSVSMQVYQEQLSLVARPDDRYSIRVWPPNGVTGPSRAGRLARAAGLYLAYPLRVAFAKNERLVHFLDHSSSHLLPRVPRRVKKVVTVHDLIPLRYSAGLTTAQTDRFRKKVENLRLADEIIAGSEHSKGSAIDLLGLDPSKITVLTYGVNPLQPCRPPHVEGADAIVFSVGNCSPRKNLKILPQALREAQRVTGKRLALLRAGERLPEVLANEITEILGPGMLVELGPVSTQEIWDAHHACDALFFPSLYEGFGLPVAEALACGKPVACSNSTSLPEVAGDLAEYFDPEDAQAAGQALARALSSDTPALVEARLKRASRFSWRRNLESIFDIYDRALA